MRLFATVSAYVSARVSRRSPDHAARGAMAGCDGHDAGATRHRCQPVRTPVFFVTMSDSDSDSVISDASSVDEVEDISDQVVLTKYRLAGDIATKVLAAVVAEAKPGKNIAELCALGV